MNPRITLQAFLALFAAAFAIRLPYALSGFTLCGDSVSYVNIARNLASGSGFTSTLKLNYFDPTPVRHLALADWPPLYPLFAGLLMRLGVSEVGLQAVNALLGAVAVGLVYLIAARLFDQRSAIVAGVFAALAPNLLRAGCVALSDALGLVLALWAVLAALSAEGRPMRWTAAGAIAGLAFLTRFPNVVLLVAFLPYAMAGRNGRACALACAAGFALASLPMFAWRWIVYGSPIYCVQMAHIGLASFAKGSWNSYGGCAPDSRFLHWNLGTAASMIYANTLAYAEDLIRGWIQFLGIGIAVAALANRREFANRDRALVLGVSVLGFAVYAGAWSVTPQPIRFLLLTYCLLLPFCATGLVWLFERKSRIAKVAAVGICAYTAFAYVQWYPRVANDAEQFQPMDARVIRWVKRSVPPSAIVASNNPWLVTHFTGRPAAALPHNLDAHGLERYVREYHIEAIVLLDRMRRTTTLRAIESAPRLFGVVKCGRDRVAVPRRWARGTPAAPFDGAQDAKRFTPSDLHSRHAELGSASRRGP